MAQCLWISSHLLETEAYRFELRESGHSIDEVPVAFQALPKLKQPYDLYFLDPYFLSWGKPEDFPRGVCLSDYLGLGLWTYDRIRERESTNFSISFASNWT